MSKLFNIKDFRQYSDTYIETGACYGESLKRAVIAGFKIVKSVEVYKPFYDHTFDLLIEMSVRKNFDWRLYLGKSTEHLKSMLPDYPAVIFLDAHPTGPNTGGHEELLNGNPEFFQDNIIRQELEIILNHRLDHIIIIDDQQPGEVADSFINYVKSMNPAYQATFYDEKLETTPLAPSKILVLTI